MDHFEDWLAERPVAGAVPLEGPDSRPAIAAAPAGGAQCPSCVLFIPYDNLY